MVVTSKAGTPRRRNTPGNAPNGVTAANTNTVSKHTPPRAATVGQPGPVDPCHAAANAAPATNGSNHSTRHKSGFNAIRPATATPTRKMPAPPCHHHHVSGMTAVTTTNVSITASFHSGANHANGTRTPAVGRNSGAYGV